MASSTVGESFSAKNIKSTMTISKAVEVFKNKHSVRTLDKLASKYNYFSISFQCDMVDRHIRAVNRIAAVNKKGFVSYMPLIFLSV